MCSSPAEHLTAKKDVNGEKESNIFEAHGKRSHTHETTIIRLKAFLTTVRAKLKALIFLALVAEPFVASLAQIQARPGVTKEVLCQACNFGTFIAKVEVVLV